MKTVEQMAREAGFQITPNPVGVPPYYIYGNTYTLLFFAQALMEECAAIADAESSCEGIAQRIAAAIRQAAKDLK